MCFLEKLREEVKFDGLENLKIQLQKDKDTACQLMDRLNCE